LSEESHNRKTLERKGRGEVVKFIRLVLSLHSIQLIVISALLMAYLAVAAANRTNKSETIQEIPRTPQGSVDGANAESPNRGKFIDEIISQPTPAEIIFKARRRFGTSPVTGQVIALNTTGIVAESQENEGGSAADQLLLGGGATMLDR
jgi:hypothetical protein